MHQSGGSCRCARSAVRRGRRSAWSTRSRRVASRPRRTRTATTRRRRAPVDQRTADIELRDIGARRQDVIVPAATARGSSSSSLVHAPAGRHRIGRGSAAISTGAVGAVCRALLLRLAGGDEQERERDVVAQRLAHVTGDVAVGDEHHRRRDRATTAVVVRSRDERGESREVRRIIGRGDEEQAARGAATARVSACRSSCRPLQERNVEDLLRRVEAAVDDQHDHARRRAALRWFTCSWREVRERLLEHRSSSGRSIASRRIMPNVLSPSTPHTTIGR